MVFRIKVEIKRFFSEDKNSNDEFIYCSPCVDCTKKITDAGIRRIVYVDKNGELTSTKVCDYHATQITSGRRFLAGIE